MKLIKNRIFIGSICLVLAFFSVFLGIKTSEKQNETIDVVKVSNNIRKGEVITEDHLTTITVGAKNMSDYAKTKDEVIGKYALTEFYSNDFILKNKVADKLPSIESKLLNLDGNRVAISVTLRDFASGMSDKIISKDIVSCIVTTEQGTTIPMELNYVEVLATTTPSGIDKQYSDEQQEENLATATLLVTPYQATLLAEYNKKADIHLALVYRGDDQVSKEFLEKQAIVIEKNVVKELAQDE